MLRTLVIDNFRAFEHLELSGLGRINLLVGKNNCGKTSVLEAIYLLATRGPNALFVASTQRGELMAGGVDFTHLFHGRTLKPGTQFTIEGEGLGSLTAKGERLRYVGRIRGGDELDAEDEEFPSGEDYFVPSRLGLALTWSGQPDVRVTIDVNDRGVASMQSSMRTNAQDLEGDSGRTHVKLLNTAALDKGEAEVLLDEFILTDEEPRLIDALRTIEPTIERIGTLSSAHGKRNAGGGIVVRCTGISRRIPIGSMGDGIWRLLGIALSLVAARNGILLIDEIDTGLHHSAMESMWKLVRETAERLNVQVFATTHSHDCTEALAAISREDVSEDSEVTIQRIEKGKPRAVAFTERKIIIAAERGIEVR